MAAARGTHLLSAAVNSAVVVGQRASRSVNCLADAPGPQRPTLKPRSAPGRETFVRLPPAAFRSFPSATLSAFRRRGTTAERHGKGGRRASVEKFKRSVGRDVLSGNLETKKRRGKEVCETKDRKGDTIRKQIRKPSNEEDRPRFRLEIILKEKRRPKCFNYRQLKIIITYAILPMRPHVNRR